MPIEWDTNVNIKMKGHPKKCGVMVSKSTKKTGKCKIHYKCEYANTPACVAMGGA
jgi:hypothetical protein